MCSTASPAYPFFCFFLYTSGLRLLFLLTALLFINIGFGFPATRLSIVNEMSPVLGGNWVVGSQGMEERVAEIGGVLVKWDNSGGIWEGSFLSE